MRPSLSAAPVLVVQLQKDLRPQQPVRPVAVRNPGVILPSRPSPVSRSVAPPPAPKPALRVIEPPPVRRLQPLAPPPLPRPAQARVSPVRNGGGSLQRASLPQPQAVLTAGRVALPPPHRFPPPPRLPAPAPHRPGNTMARPALVAVQPSVRPGVPPGTVGVVQPGFWDVATYVYDSISFASIISTIVAAIGTAVSATGLGWLAPLAIPLVGVMVQGFLAIEDDKVTGQSRKEKYLNVISGFVSGLTGAVGIIVGAGSLTGAAATTAIVAVIMIILEILRVQWLDRETVYGLVWSKIKPCCTRAEATPLLGN